MPQCLFSFPPGHKLRRCGVRGPNDDDDAENYGGGHALRFRLSLRLSLSFRGATTHTDAPPVASSALLWAWLLVAHQALKTVAPRLLVHVVLTCRRNVREGASRTRPAASLFLAWSHSFIRAPSS